MTRKNRVRWIVAAGAFSAAFLLSPVWGGSTLRWIGLAVGAIAALAALGAGPGKGGGRGPGDSCRLCGREVLAEGLVLSMQRMYLAQSNPVGAIQTEQRSGYFCAVCGRKYCKDCLERKAPSHANGGKACPACGGHFAIMR